MVPAMTLSQVPVAMSSLNVPRSSIRASTGRSTRPNTTSPTSVDPPEARREDPDDVVQPRPEEAQERRRGLRHTDGAVAEVVADFAHAQPLAARVVDELDEVLAVPARVDADGVEHGAADEDEAAVVVADAVAEHEPGEAVDGAARQRTQPVAVVHAAGRVARGDHHV